ncbi:arabinogalactan oligomer/maltooligosaccharide transport system permease protein [Allocatelliglobosispora scoriae]|uniref:Maltose/maltodextrin transport system permease protein n=1 Tax=Allocatelliglobosispora scoriae TaxID=643052 RepID=A0A841BUJ3_9ACTN|nr:ABC transporter permease subunit [Allocatelliglobosispora scoriae]MBB5870430.1 arabinogalactan oligomer/maltooligosaccharide transport system permease protein [Allocatelliglobosispora scoriae]
MTTQPSVTGSGSSGSPDPGLSPRSSQPRVITTGFLVGRVVVLGIVAALALYAVPPLIESESWLALGVVGVATLIVTYAYLSTRHVPAKYLIPGTIFLIAFQILPVLLTVSTAFTNFGDGHRGSKEDAITAIQTGSVTQVAGSPEYNLTIALRDGKLVFLLVNPTTKSVQAGTADGLSEVTGAELGITGKVLAAPGFEVLNGATAAERGKEISDLVVPTEGGAIKANGLSRAFEGKTSKRYRADCDCVTDAETGQKWVADADIGSFVDDNGQALAQGWQVNIGLANFTRVFTNNTISAHFLAVFVWNVVFALASVLTTFVLGMIVALALHSPRVRGKKTYRTFLVLPYAMPAFAMLLVWRDMFNTDFGLINRLLGTDIDWIGQPNTARFALILMNLWLGFPYMFLVTTGALQAIPKELVEASTVDGASPWQGFRRVTLPLLLVALTPLLISSFAFNFNNFNAIRLVTNGGPYAIDNASVGATDLLISYTYRVAGFDTGTADFGFAAAISVFIFAIVATISVVAFRRTRAQEEVYS